MELAFAVVTAALLLIVHWQHKDLNTERERYRAIAEAIAAKEGAKVKPQPEIEVIEKSFGKIFQRKNTDKIPNPVWPSNTE